MGSIISPWRKLAHLNKHGSACNLKEGETVLLKILSNLPSLMQLQFSPKKREQTFPYLEKSSMFASRIGMAGKLDRIGPDVF